MLRGVSRVSMDDKGRFAMPQRYRASLIQPGSESGNKMVITADPSRCLLLYTLAEWQPIEKQIMSWPSFNVAARKLQRLLVGHADDVEMDATGRLLVPPALRQYASLEKNIVLVGQGNRFEIWDQTRWDDTTEEYASITDADLPAGMGSFSL